MLRDFSKDIFFQFSLSCSNCFISFSCRLLFFRSLLFELFHFLVSGRERRQLHWNWVRPPWRRRLPSEKTIFFFVRQHDLAISLVFPLCTPRINRNHVYPLAFGSCCCTYCSASFSLRLSLSTLVCHAVELGGSGGGMFTGASALPSGGASTKVGLMTLLRGVLCLAMHILFSWRMASR